MVGYFLPCKLVYQENGTTKIGMPKPTMLVGMVNEPALKEISEDIEKRLVACIDQCRQ
ncbi:hypothetical protein TGS27_0476 [Geobacillus stearothermophilus]|uniref:DUF302 domain-containing protein n=1 Tax=Geobacillus stearothermophilus TaxID=1422 RepID=A0A150N6E1_GEOSE|nr:hypothetical protein B4109_1674 [Geobacillus stearothermophilus]KYD32162.1 hypothetical protein B4114_1705 [Geobacillus stearothermophilus]OAO87056.1 hypothetical protein TGS27_0476 [Geobacillus stearothermophilus]